MVILQRMRGRLLILFCILLLGLLGSWAFARLLVIKELSVSCNGSIAEFARQNIYSDLKKIANYSVGASDICTQLQKTVPIVHDVSIRYLSSHSAHIDIKVDRPLIIIRDKYKGLQKVLTQTGLCVPKELYNANILASLNNIYITKNADIGNLFSALKNINKEIFDTYYITWYSPVKIILQDKKNNKQIISADIKSIADKQRLAYAERIFASKKTYTKKVIHIDIRFGDYIVSGPLRGEVEYENAIGIT